MGGVTFRPWHSRLVTVTSLLVIVVTPTVKASTIYRYIGNEYTACGGSYCAGGPYGLSATFQTTLTGSSLYNLPFTDITPTIEWFQFTDGSGLVVNPATPTAYTDIEISTDSTGQILSWFAGGYTFPANTQMQTNWNSPFSFMPGVDFSETTPDFAGDYGFVSNDPGAWSVESVLVPEPFTFAMVAGGLLLLGGVGKRWPR